MKKKIQKPCNCEEREKTKILCVQHTIELMAKTKCYVGSINGFRL